MATRHYIDVDALVGGTLKLSVTFYDDTSTAVSPDTMNWTLREADTGAVVNSRSDVAIATPSSSEDIVLSGSDLTEGRKRLFLDGTYTSAAGAGLPFRAIIEFSVRPFE